MRQLPTDAAAARRRQRRHKAYTQKETEDKQIYTRINTYRGQKEETEANIEQMEEALMI